MKNTQLLAALAALVEGDLQPTKELSFGWEKFVTSERYAPRPVKNKTILKAKGKKKK